MREILVPMFRPMAPAIAGALTTYGVQAHDANVIAAGIVAAVIAGMEIGWAILSRKREGK